MFHAGCCIYNSISSDHFSRNKLKETRKILHKTRAVAKLILSLTHILQLHWHVNSLLLLNTQCGFIIALWYSLRSSSIIISKWNALYGLNVYLVQFKSVPRINSITFETIPKHPRKDCSNGSVFVLRIWIIIIIMRSFAIMRRSSYSQMIHSKDSIVYESALNLSIKWKINNCRYIVLINS